MAYEVKLLASFGTGEPWVARVVIALPELLDATPLEPESKEEARRAIGLIHEELGMASQTLRDVERLAAQPSAAELELLRAYTDLYDHLWRAYKDRFPKLACALGYDIGFLFQKQATFEARLEQFVAENPGLPADFAAMLARGRASWQNGLALFRNEVLQHRHVVDPRLVRVLLRPDSARTVFDNVWQAIEDIATCFISLALPPIVALDQIPERDRDTSCPRRFRLALTAPIGESTQ